MFELVNIDLNGYEYAEHHFIFSSRATTTKKPSMSKSVEFLFQCRRFQEDTYSSQSLRFCNRLHKKGVNNPLEVCTDLIINRYRLFWDRTPPKYVITDF
jgi:hypothetical protein